MAESSTRTQAIQRWRERTGLKLVQVYLHTDTVQQLDNLVETQSARGRAAVVARLIEDAAKSLHTDIITDPVTDAVTPTVDPGENGTDLDNHNGQCMASTTRGYRCRSEGKSWRPIELNGQHYNALVCTRHFNAPSMTVHPSQCG